MGAGLAALLLVGVLVVSLSGPANGERESADGPPDVLVLVTGTRNESRPALPDDGRTLLRETSVGADDHQPNAMVLGVDGDGTTTARTVDLTPRRGTSETGDEENTPKRREIAADRNVEKVNALVADVTATVPGHSLLAGLQEAGRVHAPTIVVVSSGIDTNDPFDLRRTGFDFPDDSLVGYLRSKDALPHLDGTTVILAISPADGRQEKLDEPSRRNVERLWTAILRASGAAVQPVASASSEAPTGTVDSPRVPIPKITTPAPAPGPAEPAPQKETFVLPAALLFVPNEPTLLRPDDARAKLRGLADQVRGRATLTIVGHTPRTCRERSMAASRSEPVS